MTRTWRAGILIAFFAALLGAPSAVLGAPPNRLSAPTVSATSGSTSTTFTFGVRYTSSGQAAGGVTVSVAGDTLDMARVSGSPTDGRYQVSASLPAGAWVPTFEAHPSKGPQPSIAGPQVHVGAPATPKPSKLPSPTPLVVDPPSSTEVMPADDAATPAPVAEAQPPAAGAVSATVDEAPNSVSEAGASTHEHVDATAGPAKAASGEGRSAPAAPVDPAPGTAASDSPDTAASPSSGSRHSPAPGLAAAPFIGSDSPWTVLALAVFGIATLSTLAIAWMLLGRRRRGDDDQPLPAAGAVPRGVPTTEQLLGRAARRSRLDPSDDPIVAAMGLLPPTDATPRYMAGQVNQGPGERPLSETKRRRRS